MIKCSQCDNQAMYQVKGHYLCLHCYEKLMRIHQQQQAQLASMINYLYDQVDEITGIPTTPRLRVSQPVVHKGNITQNLINIDRSIIGTVNTGKIDSLNQSMNNINNQVNPDIAKILAQFTEAMLRSQEINESTKEQLLEEIAFLSEQILVNKSLQKKSMLKRVLDSIKDKLSTAAALLTVWDKLYPILKTYFGV